MTVESANTQYSFRAWDRRPGDGVDPSPVVLNPVQTIMEVEATAPMPLPAPVTLNGSAPAFGKQVPTIEDVLRVSPTGGLLMNDTPTRQDSGMQGTLRPATGAW
jgi:hypothetical protein